MVAPIETVKLEAAIAELEGLELGTQLVEELQELGRNRGLLRVLVLVSARRDINAIFPCGLQLQPHWVMIEGDQANNQHNVQVENFDLIIWGMSALRFFPADYAPILEIARQKEIPIWALVVGLGFLSDYWTFTNQIVPFNKKQLPPFSDIILCEKSNEASIGVVMQMLEQQGKKIAKAGYSRRERELTESLLAQILQQKEKLNYKIDRISNLMEAAKLGSQSLVIMSGAMAREICGGVRGLQALLQESYQQILREIEEQKDMASLGVVVELSQTVSKLWSQKLEKEIEQQPDKRADKVALWCEEAVIEMRKFFNPLKNLGESAEIFESTISVTSEEFRKRFQSVFDEFSENIAKGFEVPHIWLEPNTLLKGFGLADNSGELSSTRLSKLQEVTEGESRTFVPSSTIIDANIHFPSDENRLGTKLWRWIQKVPLLGHIIPRHKTDEQTEKEQILVLFGREVELTEITLVKTFNSLQEACQKVLSEIIQEQTAVVLKIADQAMSKQLTLKTKLTTAEKILRGEK